MPDMWVDVDTAVKVPVNVLPLLDDTDFKSIETAVAYNATGLAVTWNFVTSAGVVSGTAVTPTTGGNYDWEEPIADKGMYSIEIPASGGASINNDTEGYGWFTGVATGVLPWRGPVIGFRRAALNDMFCDGSTASTNFEDMFDGTGYAGGTAKLDVNVVNAAGTAWGSGAITAASIATGAIDADALAADAGTEIGTAVWASADRQLTALDEDVTTIDINGTTIGTVTNVTNAVTLANGAHGGAAASLTLGAGATISNASGSALTLTSTGGNGHGMLAQGNGTGSGITGAGGATGNGLYVVGDGTGHGAYILSGDGTIAYGMLISSQATLNQRGLYIEDGATITSDNGTGLLVSSTATDTNGMEVAGAGTGGDIVADITGNISGSIGSVTGAVGSVTGAVGSVATGGITAASIAQNAIDADSLATDAITEIQSGLALQTSVDDLEGRLTATRAGYLDNLSGGAVALQSSVDDLEGRLTATRAGYLDNLSAGAVATASSIAALNNLSAAQVNAEVVDALNVDTYAEPGQGAPAATASIAAKINYIYKSWRNKKTQTATTRSIYNDAGDTVDQKATDSDDGTTFTKGEIGSGP